MQPPPRKLSLFSFPCSFVCLFFSGKIFFVWGASQANQSHAAGRRNARWSRGASRPSCRPCRKGCILHFILHPICTASTAIVDNAPYLEDSMEGCKVSWCGAPSIQSTEMCDKCNCYSKDNGWLVCSITGSERGELDEQDKTWSCRKKKNAPFHRRGGDIL